MDHIIFIKLTLDNFLNEKDFLEKDLTCYLFHNLFIYKLKLYAINYVIFSPKVF